MQGGRWKILVVLPVLLLLLPEPLHADPPKLLNSKTGLIGERSWRELFLGLPLSDEDAEGNCSTPFFSGGLSPLYARDVPRYQLLDLSTGKSGSGNPWSLGVVLDESEEPLGLGKLEGEIPL